MNVDQHSLLESVAAACRWITEVALVRTRDLGPDDENPLGLPHTDWRGALRGEYSAAKRKWSFFCPIWHGGQAIKALTMATRAGAGDWREDARVMADFILREQVVAGADAGLIKAWEGGEPGSVVSAMLECLDGLLHLAENTGETRYRDAALRALDWVARKAYLDGEGLFLDLYDVEKQQFADHPYPTKDRAAGRPLLDDAMFLKGYRLTGNRRWRQMAVETADRLLRDEDPAGNWLHYGPCQAGTGSIHPRHAYWWGFPMLMVSEETGDRKYLELAIRSADWYLQAQRHDGGLFRGTYTDGKTDSFGHATSGVACAMILWATLREKVPNEKYLQAIRLGIDYCRRMQFARPHDSNLRGAILEKLLPPDGTDASPYYLRDLGTIFYVQALSLLLTQFTSERRPVGL